MATWNSAQYLKFAGERTQPSIDLAARVALEAPRRIVDLGCGPGNSTAVLGRRWPAAELTGLDSSGAMLEAARRDFPAWRWIEGEIADWADRKGGRSACESFDLVFSNAALQWVPGHAALVPKLFGAVGPGGALAFQVPHSLEAPHQRCIRDLAASAPWKGRFVRPPVSWHVEPAGFYYDLLAPVARRVESWLTDYLHALAGPEGVVQWHRGTGLRPFLEALPDEAAREDFLGEYLAAVSPHYSRQADGRILMPFRRLFVVAYR